MSSMGTTPSDDLFDQWAASTPDDAQDSALSAPESAPASNTTPVNLRRAMQELLKHGLLEQQSKPQLFRQMLTETARINTLLEPLDLELRLDDTRGLTYVAIPASYQPDEDEGDEWTHPLVRRQRLTLEQSLLLAVLRREFLQQEQERGIGVPVYTSVEQLLPQLEIYLGASGSEMQDRKRLLTLLEHLRSHGVVSEVDAQERVLVRPMIVHLANPQNLQALLQHLRKLTQPKQQEEAHADDE